MDVAIERIALRGELNEFEKAHVIDKIDVLKNNYEEVALRKVKDGISISYIYNNLTINESWKQIESHLKAKGLYEHLQRL